jgi:hypothetical protein
VAIGPLQTEAVTCRRLRHAPAFCYLDCGLATFDLSPGQTAFVPTSTTIAGPYGSRHVA